VVEVGADDVGVGVVVVAEVVELFEDDLEEDDLKTLSIFFMGCITRLIAR
jgi:hypothetical protein